jgi:Phytoene dehydrogenase and related proteins
MAYMLSDFYREGVCLDFPRGGSASIVEALVRGVTKHDGCELLLNTHVERILVKDERAAGVQTRCGATIWARKAVISNADLWTTRKLVDARTAPELAVELDARAARVGSCDSFLHFPNMAGGAPPSPEHGRWSAATRSSISLTWQVERCDSFLHLPNMAGGALRLVPPSP